MKLWPYITAVICLGFSLEAQALSTFDTATRFYQARQYARAGALYQTFVQENPRNYQGHYQLANCYCALGNWEKASYHYGMLLVIPCPSDMQSRAREAITMVVRKQMHLPQIPAETTQAVATSSKDEAVNPKTMQEDAAIANMRKKAQDIYDEQSKRYEFDKQTILADAEAKASRVEKEAKDRCDYLRENHPFLCTTGHNDYFMNLPTEFEEEIMAPAREEAKRIRTQAMHRTAKLRNESRIQESVDGFQKQALAGGNGVKLDLNTSNLHLRNYTQPTQLAKQENKTPSNTNGEKRQVAAGKSNLQ
jgi:hypothetical protein